jgi:hypothetical protein
MQNIEAFPELFHRTVHLFSLTKPENMDSFDREQLVASMVLNRKFISTRSRVMNARVIALKADLTVFKQSSTLEIPPRTSAQI